MARSAADPVPFTVVKTAMTPAPKIATPIKPAPTLTGTLRPCGSCSQPRVMVFQPDLWLNTDLHLSLGMNKGQKAEQTIRTKGAGPLDSDKLFVV
jgi:hypothetical protein